LRPRGPASLTADKARRAIAALGGTPYELRSCEFAVDEGLFLGVGDLKELRRVAVAALDERRLGRWRRAAPAAPTSVTVPATAALAAPTVSTALHIVLRVRLGEEPIAWEGVDALCLDLRSGDDVGSITAAVARARRQGVALRVRAPEVLFDSDEPWVRAVAALGWDAVYARHVAALSWADTCCSSIRCRG